MSLNKKLKILTVIIVIQFVTCLTPIRTSSLNLETSNESFNRKLLPRAILTDKNKKELSDFRKLLEQEQMRNQSEICFKGVWLIYGQPNFNAPTIEDVHLFTGYKSCIQLKNTSVGSVQPLGSNKLRKESITLFEKPNFGSVGVPYFKETKVMGLKRRLLPTVGSFATFGKSSWTLFDTEGLSLCIKPKSSFDNPTCLVTNFNSIKFEQKEIGKLSGLIMGCNNDYENSEKFHSRTIYLTNCREFNMTKMESIQDEGMSQPNEKSNKNNCSKNPKLDKKIRLNINEDLILRFAKLRFSYELSTKTEQFLWPKNPEDIWKREIIDRIYDIAMLTIPEMLISKNYFQIVREMTFYHLDGEWKQNNRNTSSFLRIDQFDRIISNLKECYAVSQEYNENIEYTLMEEFNQNYQTSKVSEEGIIPEFKRNSSMDTVIETTWLITNYVFGLCHHLINNGTKSTFETDYINVTLELYFIPLKLIWKNGQQIFEKSYGAILSGFGVDEKLKILEFITSMVFSAVTQELQPLDRPF